jgi:hypothetical protein
MQHNRKAHSQSIGKGRIIACRSRDGDWTGFGVIRIALNARRPLRLPLDDEPLRVRTTPSPEGEEMRLTGRTRQIGPRVSERGGPSCPAAGTPVHRLPAAAPAPASARHDSLTAPPIGLRSMRRSGSRSHVSKLSHFLPDDFCVGAG